MLFRCFGLCCVFVVAGSVESFSQQQTGIGTLESPLKPSEAAPAQRPLAVDATASGSPLAGRIQGAVARPKNGVQHPDLDAAWAEYDKQVEAAAKAVELAIEKELNAAASAGDLDNALKWKTAAEQFQRDGRIPDGLSGVRPESRPKPSPKPKPSPQQSPKPKPRPIQSGGGPSTALAEAWGKLADTYVAVEKDLVRSNAFDRAKQARAEKESLAKASGSATQPPNINGTWLLSNNVRANIFQDGSSIRWSSQDAGYTYRTECDWDGKMFVGTLLRTSKANACTARIKVLVAIMSDTDLHIDQSAMDARCDLPMTYMETFTAKKQ